MAKQATKKTEGKETSKKSTNVFADGIITFPPHEKAPDFVKAVIKIDLKKLSKWGNDNLDKFSDFNGNKQLSLTVKESQDGKFYASVDTYGTEFAKVENDTDDLPF